MITLETQVSGGQLGRQLRQDAEETWYLLDEISDKPDPDFFTEVANNAGQASMRVVKFLRDMADAIEKVS